MTYKQITIDDQKKTIHRLQDEGTEKTNTIIALGERLKRKEQECEILKDEYKILEDNLDSRTRDFADVIDSYKQTLAEIKEIAEVLITTTDEYDSCYYKDKCSKCEVKEDCQYFKVEQILQKISEAENEITTR